MAMNQKEKEVLFSNIKDNLSSIVGASGNPEELVRLTTAIVQGTKRLLEGVPEGMTNTSTSALTAFVLCAKSVAKNPRGVDAKVIQQLSSTRGEVEKNIQVLEKWHFRTRSPIPEDLSEVLGDISKQQDNRKSPESQADPDREKNLTWELQRKRDALLLKMDPQQAPDPFDDPQNVMVTAVQGLMKGADELTKYGDGKMPSKDVLLEPMILVVEMVCKLLDLVDGLFVSKYPMRSQVYSFCTALIDNVLAYGNRTKSDDILSLRNISTQTPALLNASKVMVEQCETRLSSVKSNMMMSMMRTSELKGMDDTVKDGINPVARKRNKPPPAPSAKPKKEQVKPKPDVEVCCMVCTSIAVDQKTQTPISRGTELILMVHASATIKDIKQDLASRTGIVYDSIQLNHQGQEELGDSCTINPNNPSPYFFFNRDEPTEEELREKRKDDRKKNKSTIENLDWSQVKGPIAVAVFEYDTLGDEKSLAFDEGDIIEILEKSADGWWEGRSGDNSGTFPASFVKEITSKEEGLRLFESSKNGGNSSSLLEPESNERGTSSPLEGHSSDISITTSHSPKPFSKKKKPFSRGMSTPEFNTSDFAKVREMKEKGLSLFQKKKKSSGYANLTVYNEEIPERQESPVEPPSGKHSPKPPKPLFKPRKSFGSSSGISRPPRVLGDDLVVEKAPQHRTVSPNTPPQEQSSPGLKPKEIDEAIKKPPPPRPQPFAKTHPTQAAKLDALIKSQESVEEEEVISLSAKAKASNSMEDLLKNLQDFEEAESVDPTIASTSNHPAPVEYETYDRPITPPHHNEVETIKISEYKSDSETEHTEEELDGIDDEEVDNEVKSEKKMEIPLSSLTVQQDWNPHEWTPSPEPPKHSSRKPPSWSIDVNVTQDKEASMPRRNTADSMINSQKKKPTPPPKVMSRPRRSISGSPKVTPSGSPKVTPTPSPRETPSGSPKLPSKSEHPPPLITSHSPIAPPRHKKKINNGSVDGPSRRGPSRAPPPPPPYKTSGIPNSRSDAEMLGSKAVPGLQRRLTVSKQREQLRSKPMVRSRSPIVQRKTKAIVKTDTHLTRDLLFNDCTGIGKSGILYKEGSQSPDWKARHFNVVEDGILYYDSPHNWSGKDPLGEIPVKQIIKAMSVDPRGTYHCFVILMRYETSILLGAEEMEDAVDWVKSINIVVKLVRHKDKPLSYLASTSATEYCLYYLLHASVPLSKKVFKLSHDFGQMNDWLDQINKGEEASLSHLSNPSSAVCLLKALLTPDKLGYVIPSEIAKDVSVKVKRNASMADIKAKLHHLHDDMLHILHLFLSVFSKALSSNDTKPTDKIEVSDLNRMFGAGLFEGLKPNQSLTLLNFMITQYDTMF